MTDTRRVASMGPIIARWMEANLVFTKGRWIGQPFRLLEWQHDTLTELFEVEQRPDGKWWRRYTEALIGIPKKNGKTELAAGLGLYFTIEDPEPAPEIYCVANSDKQADLVFGAAKTMAALSPTLKHIVQPFKDTLLVPERPGAKLVRVSAAVGTNDGLNVYIVIFDELHEFTDSRGRALFDVMVNGQAAREQPLTIEITTAGHDLETLCGEKYQFGKRVEAGEVQSPRFFFRWWEAPKDADWRDESTWKAANPSFGVTVLPDYYQRRIDNNIRPAVFERYHLNRWTDAEDPWLPSGAWAACKVDDFKIELDQPLWVGSDFSIRHDATAVVMAQWNPATGRLRLKPRIWEKPINPTTGKPVDDWRVPTIEVENHLRLIHTTTDAQAFGYDPAYFHASSQQLEAEGLPMLEVPQTDARMVPACQALYDLIVNGQVEHDGDPAFARHMAAAVAVPARGGDGGWRLKKGKSKRKIDAAIAAAIATGLAVTRATVEESEKKAPNVY